MGKKIEREREHRTTGTTEREGEGREGGRDRRKVGRKEGKKKGEPSCMFSAAMFERGKEFATHKMDFLET